MNIKNIQKSILDGQYRETLKFFRRRIERDILFAEVTESIMSGKIIEKYPEDKRGSSCLIHGTTRAGRHLHICCTPYMPVWLITVYEPNMQKWEPDMKTRKPKDD